MSGKSVFVFCGDDCKSEAMTKEQILTAIEQAVSTGEIKDVDTGFVTKLKEMNKNSALSFWVGTTAQYNALPEKPKDCLCILTDEITILDLQGQINNLQNDIEVNVTKLETQQEHIENLYNEISLLKESLKG